MTTDDLPPVPDYDEAPGPRLKTLSELALEVHNTSMSKGFDAPSWESNFLAKLMLIHTEIDEAIDDSEDLDAFQLELADIAIRTLSVLHNCFHGEWDPWRVERRQVLPRKAPVYWDHPAVVFHPLRRLLTVAAEHWRKDERRDAGTALELALLGIFRIADRCLQETITRKNAMNLERPFRHGKKATG